MKNVFLAIFLLQSSLTYSAVIKKPAVIRDENFKVQIEEVSLPDLTRDDAYEGKFFKIVKGKDEEAIHFDAPAELQLKAATTYYHLNKARKFFSENVKSSFVQHLPQLTIRLDLINVFNEVGHFANDNLDPQFNNALSVPAGAGYSPKNVNPWNTEIWFRPAKKIDIREYKGPVDFASTKAALHSFRNQTHMVNLQQFFTSIFSDILNSTASDSGNLIRLVESSIMIEVIYESSDLITQFLSRKIYRLDSALVPEIIYHEFSHVALSDHLELTHSTPVNEGLADYFAGKISNSKKLATKIKDYNLFSGKEVKRKQQYRMEFERGDYANTDFVFGLLWNVGETVGIDKEAQFMYKMSSKIDTNDSIRDGLIEATLETCKEMCQNPFNDRLRLYKFFNSKNI